MNIKNLSIVLISTLSLLVSINTFAQERISPGCIFINEFAIYLVGTYRALYVHLEQEFYAGERIVVSSGEPYEGLPTQTRLTLNSVDVDTDGFPGTVSHQFLTDQTLTDGYSWSIDSGAATWVPECIPEDALPVTPVPTFNWLGVIILLLSISGFAFASRIKFCV